MPFSASISVQNGMSVALGVPANWRVPGTECCWWRLGCCFPWAWPFRSAVSTFLTCPSRSSDLKISLCVGSCRLYYTYTCVDGGSLLGPLISLVLNLFDEPKRCQDSRHLECQGQVGWDKGQVFTGQSEQNVRFWEVGHKKTVSLSINYGHYGPSDDLMWFWPVNWSAFYHGCFLQHLRGQLSLGCLARRSVTRPDRHGFGSTVGLGTKVMPNW